MKPEILFRGIDAKTGKWVKGCLLKIARVCIIYHGSNTEYGVKPNEGAAIELYNDEISVIHEKTLGQFTGETDSNGTLIFDGDIVSDATGMTYIVFWDDKGQWCASDEFGETELLSDIITDTTTVIGSIHDNK